MLPKMRSHFLLLQGRTKVKLAGLFCGIQLERRMTAMVSLFVFSVFEALKYPRGSEREIPEPEGY